MIIGCPKCKTRFVVAPQAIGKDGRMVRCSRCSKTWFQDAPDEALEIVPEKVIIPPEKQTSEKSKGSKPGIPAGEKIKSNVPAVVKEKSFIDQNRWVLVVAVLAAVVASLYYFREPLEDRFEVAETFYQQWDAFVADQRRLEPQIMPEPEVVLPHNKTFLTLSHTVTNNFNNGIPTLSIDGEIKNSADFNIDLPGLNVVIKNIAGDMVFSSIQILEPSVVTANDTLQFKITIPDIPPDSAEVEMSLMWDEAP